MYAEFQLFILAMRANMNANTHCYQFMEDLSHIVKIISNCANISLVILQVDLMYLDFDELKFCTCYICLCYLDIRDIHVIE